MPYKRTCENRYNLQQSVSSMQPKDVLVKLKEWSIAVNLKYISHAGTEEMIKTAKTRNRRKEEKFFISVNFMYISHRTKYRSSPTYYHVELQTIHLRKCYCPFFHYYCILPPKNAKKERRSDVFSTVDKIIFSDSVSY